MRGLSRTVFALVASLIFATPFLAAIYQGVDFTEYANESLAYRYFLSERLFGGEPILIWNGHFTSLIQHLGYWILDRGGVLPPVPDLRGRAQAFALWTLGVSVAAAGGLMLLMARDTKLTSTDTVVVGAALVIPVWCTGNAGFNYCLFPDYYVFSVILLALSVWAFLRTYRTPVGKLDLRAVAIVGALCGVLASNKLYLAVMAMPTLALVILGAESTWRFRWFAATVGLGAALLAFGLVVWAFVLFDWGATKEMVRFLCQTLQGVSGEYDFFSQSFWIQVRLYGYHWYAAFWFVMTVLAFYVAAVAKDPRDRTIAIAGLLTGMISLMLLAKRPSDTTAFEVSAMLLATGLMLWPILELRGLTIARWFVLGGLLAVALVPSHVYFGVFQWLFGGSKRDADLRWEMFQESLEFAAGKPLVVVIPDNEYHHEGVFEMLIKGLSQFPSWDMNAHGTAVLQRYAPNLTLTHDRGGAFENYNLPSDGIVLWFEWPGKREFSQTYLKLSKLLERNGGTCRYWTITKRGNPQVDAIACPTRHP